MKNACLFLDRDGVINHDPGDYTCSVKEFTILPDVKKSLVLAQEKGFKIVLITNQAGIAKGRYSLNSVYEIHAFLRDELAKADVEITDIYWSPYHSSLSESLTRKPDSLLIEKAVYKHNIDPNKSLMIGDKQRDLDAAAKVGIKGELLPVNTSFYRIVEQWNP